jgi:hypothetical protein
MLESEYQAFLIKKLEKMFPGCRVLKNDANYMQGIPDLTVLYNGRYALLEVKASEKSKERPNQRYYIEQAGLTAYAAFIYPENESEVLDALQSALGR